MKIFFSTVVRGAPLKEGGEFIKLDWENKSIDKSIPIYPANPELKDPNPRGNTRGGRGIELLDNDMVIVATYHSLKLFNHELDHVKDITNNLMVGLHEIKLSSNQKILVSATAIDAAFEVDIDTGYIYREYWPREMHPFQAGLNIMPLAINKNEDNRDRFLSRKHLEHSSHLHLNAVSEWNGEVYGLFHALGCIANLSKPEIVIRDNHLKGAHNIVITKDGIAIVNDTYRRSVCFYDLNLRKFQRAIHLTQYKAVRSLVTLKQHMLYDLNRITKKFGYKRISAPRPFFIRGLDTLGELLFVGLSPASILCIDLKTERLLDVYNYSDDLSNCIHGLKVLA